MNVWWKKTMLAADCWLHGQVIVHQHFLDHEQTSYTKHDVLLVS